jgi:hypothetical protein
VQCTTTDLTAKINAAAPGDALNLAPGCLYTYSAPDNVVTNPDNALPVITKALTIYGNGSIIQRNPAMSTPKFRIFQINSPGNLTLNNLTIRNGHSAAGVNTGGGIEIGAGGTLRTNSSKITNNTSDDHGGGIHNGGGTVALTSTTVNGNTAALDGGGLSMNGGTTTINSGSVTGNNAMRGGGLFLSGTATINGTLVGGNSVSGSADGGGVFVDSGSTTLTSSRITGNTATSGPVSEPDGAGIFNKATLNLSGTPVSGNIGTGEFGKGGGILNSGGTVTVTGSPVFNNAINGPGANGGGIFNNGTTTLNGSPVFSNTPDNCGTPSTVPGCV